MTDNKKKFQIALCNIVNLVSFGCKEDFKQPILDWLKKLQDIYESKETQNGGRNDK